MQDAHCGGAELLRVHCGEQSIQKGEGMNKRVVVAGHICVDITPEILGEKVSNLNEILAPGKLIPSGDITISTGGAVANTGLSMKLFGADVALMGKLGNDDFGSIVQRALRGYGCENDMIVSDGDVTSYSIILAIPGIDRIFFHNPGANDVFYLKDMDMDKIKDAALFHFGYPPIMRSMYENRGAELVRIFQTVSELGVLTSLDLAMIQEQTEAGRADWNEILGKVLPYTDFFLPSVEELLLMLDKDKYHAVLERSAGRDITEVISLEEDVKVLAERCIAMGAGCVIIKCGAPGLYYKTAGEGFARRLSERLGQDHSDWADREGFEASYVPSKIRSGTGAGDTAIGAFLTAMLNGYPFGRCMQLAAAAGASCVEAYDALSGLKSFAELEERIDGGWEKNPVNI